MDPKQFDYHDEVLAYLLPDVSECSLADFVAALDARDEAAESATYVTARA